MMSDYIEGYLYRFLTPHNVLYNAVAKHKLAGKGVLESLL